MSAPETARLAYTAFISYSHAADGALAPVLQRALQAFAKPWYRRRAIRVFRDTTGLGPTPDLWDGIRAALEASEYFILLASVRAAQSPWIELEVEAWLRKSSSDRLLIVWTDGELIWDHATGDFDWQRTTCLPPRLRAQFRAEPLYLDLRWARTTNDLSPRRPEFLDAVARLSATLRQLPVDDLVGEDIRQHRRLRRLAGSAVTALAVLLVASVVAAGFAFQQRNAAQRRLVELTVANGVREIADRDLSASALWFAEALRLDAGRPREQRLQRIRLGASLHEHPGLRQVWSADSTITRRWVWFGRDGRHVISVGRREEIDWSGGSPQGISLPGDGPEVWDTQSGEPVPITRSPQEQLLAVDSSVDGVRLLRATADGSARMLDMRSGAELARFDHPDDVISAEFSGDGQLLLTEAADNAVRVWNTADGRLLDTMKHESALVGAGFTADRQRVLSLTEDGAAHVWTPVAAPKTATQISLAHDDPVEEVDATADGRFAVTLAGRTARLWDLKSADSATLLYSWIGVNHAEFSPDGSRLLMADDFGEASVWRLDPIEEAAVVRHESPVLHATFSPDGKLIATASTDHVARVWDAASGAPLSPPLYHEDTVTHVAFDPGQLRLATVTAGNLVRVWELTRAPPALMHEAIERAVFHPDGNRLLTVGPSEVKLWDLHRGALFTLSVGSQIYDAAFSPDGRRIAIASEDGLARIWDADTGKELLSLRHDRRVKHVSFHPDGVRLATAGAAGQTNAEVSVWNLATGDKLFSLPHPSERPDYVEFSPDGTRVLTLGARAAHIWDLARKQVLPSFNFKDVRSAAFSPDGSLLLVREGSAGVSVYDIARGLQVGPTIKHENYMLDHANFGADANTLVVVGGGYARIWNARDGSAITPPLEHATGTQVTYADASRNGEFVATVASDGSARLWDARTGQALSPPLVHGSDVRHVAFSPDGSRIVTSGGDRARVWRLSVGRSTESEQQLSLSARVLAARQIDATGAVVPLTAAQFREAWKQLQALQVRRPDEEVVEASGALE